MDDRPPYRIDLVRLFTCLGTVVLGLVFWFGVHYILCQLLEDQCAASGVWVALTVLALVVAMIFVDKSGGDDP